MAQLVINRLLLPYDLHTNEKKFLINIKNEICHILTKGFSSNKHISNYRRGNSNPLIFDIYFVEKYYYNDTKTKYYVEFCECGNYKHQNNKQTRINKVMCKC